MKMRSGFLPSKKGLLPLFCIILWLSHPSLAAALNVEKLEPSEIDTLESILQTLEPHINQAKESGSANLLSWDDLYRPLDSNQRALLDAFRALRAENLGATSHYFGELARNPDLIALEPQQIVKDGTLTPLDPQYLPRPVHEAYERMMQEMQDDIGKRLLVESGYRSPAYQLYLFLYYLPKHDHSIVETNRFVALPGHSEHGNPKRQAIDLINQEGINGEDHPEEFEALAEYRWLQQNAQRFGFHLSYPRDNPYHTAFEPWHWHFENSDQ